MARMFIEGRVGTHDTVRSAAQQLMRDLDAEAAAAGQRVVGDVTISDAPHPLLPGQVIRLEADVEARH